jgi:hypothetical protein
MTATNVIRGHFANKPRTLIRIGAAHFDCRMAIGGRQHHIDLAEEVRGIGLAAWHQRMTLAAAVVCEFHGIEKAQPAEKPPREPRRAKPKRAGGWGWDPDSRRIAADATL